MFYVARNPERLTSEDLEGSTSSLNSSSNRRSEQNTNQLQSATENTIYSGVPPYLIELPIVDNTLYVKHDSDKFHLGGSNLPLIRYAASIRSGGNPSIQDQEGYIEFTTSEQPYIEFSYNEKFYSVRVIARSYSTSVEIREITGPTVELNRKFGG